MIEYKKHTWVDGEVIEAGKLNNIEEGVSELAKEVSKTETWKFTLEDGRIVEKVVRVG